MAYASLARCVKDLEEIGELRRIDVELDPKLELAAIQRRVIARGGPALLFTNVRGCSFPLLAGLFGTKQRLEYIFRRELPAVRSLFELAGEGVGAILRRPASACKRLMQLIWPCLHMCLRRVSPESAPVLKHSCRLADLPRFVSWPGDGGAFITLPLVYSEDPVLPGYGRSNLGMYRIQLDGNDYAADEVGLHYQIHRGIGVHHAHALEKGLSLPVHIYVGGPPALSLAAVMPLPEGMSELRFAGLLGGQGVALASSPNLALPVLAEADFLLAGRIGPVTKPEGPFGDHLGYYSLRHHFPCIEIEHVTHRPNAIWPFTSVGRPPQEDTVFGEFIHELTQPLLPRVFHGISEVHAVDAAGVHPLLLALGHERYTPYEARRKPREILTQALHLLGTSQTSLAKYLLIAAAEDAPALTTRDLQSFFRHMLERTDFSRDLHLLTDVSCDTLDYTGGALNEGSKLIWAAAGEKAREIRSELTGLPDLPPGFSRAALASPGVLVLKGPAYTASMGEQDRDLVKLAQVLSRNGMGELYPLVVVVDDADFTTRSFANFLWVTFTRSDPARDTYGLSTGKRGLSIAPPLIIDARCKPWYPPELEENPETVRRIEDLACAGGPLAGLW